MSTEVTDRDDRRNKMIELRKTNTLKKIGDIFGLSRERVRQIIDSGHNKKKLKRKKELCTIAEQIRIRDRWGLKAVMIRHGMIMCIFCSKIVNKPAENEYVCLDCRIKKSNETDFSYFKDMTGRDRIREMVRIRDRHTCADCKLFKPREKGVRSLDVHHLNGLCGKLSRKYDKVKDIGGLITLCHKCHYNRPDHTLKSRKVINR